MSMAWNGWSSMIPRPAWPCTAPGKSTVAQRPSGACANRIWKRSRRAIPTCVYQDFLSNVTESVVYLRTDMPPFNDVRVRRAISMAIDRQGIIEGVYIRGEPTPAIARGADGVVAAHRSAR